MTAETDDLVATAQLQLEQHREWLASRISELPESAVAPGEMLLLAVQARQIRLRVAKVSAQTATVVWDYPDELHAFLNSDRAPKDLKDTLAGGHVVNPNQPAWSVRRAGAGDEE